MRATTDRAPGPAISHDIPKHLPPHPKPLRSDHPTPTMSTGVGLSSCCLSGKIQTGKPKGREAEIAGLQTYIAEPENGSPSRTVVFLVDIFGWTLPNIRLL